MSPAENPGHASAPVSLRVYHQHAEVFSTSLDTVVEVGRQQHGEAAPYCRLKNQQGARVVVANLDEAGISRQHLRLEPLAGGRVCVTNLSKAVPVMTDSSGAIAAGGQLQLTPPFVVHVGEPPMCRSLRVEADQTDALPLVSLANVTMAPGQRKPPSTHLQTMPGLGGSEVDEQSETLVQWMYAAMAVFQAAASSPDFLLQAAQAVVDLVGLDTAAVITWNGREWQSDAVCTKSGSVNSRWRPSTSMLDRVRSERRTFRNAPKLHAASLMGVEALVAAPILDAQGDVIGALYGDRRQAAPDRSSLEITHLEAMLVELLASGVAAGLARLEQEKEAIAARVRFEQVFTPHLARQLETQPDLLEGKDAEISALFCDVRHFSRISERLGAVRTFAWISDVMEELSECVQRHDGVLVDFVGDELIAMWGAPVPLEQHAALACQAALEMIQKLAALNQRWQTELGEPMDLGVGVNSGVARVGNTGCSKKFKYGPLGNTVNLASRVQGATKHVKAQVLITGQTAAHLGPELARRRLCRVRVVNIAEPVELYELVAQPDEHWQALKQGYEAALAALEKHEFYTATKYLGNLIAEYPHDGPSQLLLSRAVTAMINPDDFDPVWTLSGK